MMPADPSMSNKGRSPAERLDIFGSFLDSVGSRTADLSESILAAASVPEGVKYSDLLVQARKFGVAPGVFLDTFDKLLRNELVEKTDGTDPGEKIVRATSAGRAYLGPRV